MSDTPKENEACFPYHLRLGSGTDLMACRNSENSDQPLLFILRISPDPQSVDAQE